MPVFWTVMSCTASFQENYGKALQNNSPTNAHPQQKQRKKLKRKNPLHRILFACQFLISAVAQMAQTTLSKQHEKDIIGHGPINPHLSP